MPSRLAVVVSQGPSDNPAKRALEQSLLAGLRAISGLDLLVVPHLYDLRSAGPALCALRQVQGDLVVASWLYGRATRWILDRHGIRGRPGDVQIRRTEDEGEGDLDRGEADEKDRVGDRWEIPERRIYCLDLRIAGQAEPYVGEVRRIAASFRDDSDSGGTETTAAYIEEPAKRRWYPVIDYSRCTNCLECVDFCLFGVYGIDEAETILVEQPDLCRQGCPACSRVCPENAILFPQHKTPAIAGASGKADALKLDLSQLFGAPPADTSPQAIASAEREEHVRRSPPAAGREPAMPSPPRDGERASQDELDDLLDALDEFDA